MDNFFITGKNKLDIYNIIQEIAKEIKIQDMGEISTFFDNKIEIDSKNRTILIHQKKYTNNILEKYNKNTIIDINISYEIGIKLRKSEN